MSQFCRLALVGTTAFVPRRLNPAQVGCSYMFIESRRHRGGHTTGPSIADSGSSLWDRAYNRVFGSGKSNQEKLKHFVPDAVDRKGAGDENITANQQVEASRTVVLGKRLLQSIQDKATVAEVRRHLDPFLMGMGARANTDFVTEEALHYLLVPTSQTLGDVPHVYVTNFQDHLTQLLDLNEDPVLLSEVNKEKSTSQEPSGVNEAVQDSNANVLLIRLMTALALADIHVHKYHHALECARFGIAFTREPSRRAGLLALQAGVLNALHRHTEAHDCADKALRLSDGMNSQAYLHGAAALKGLGKAEEARALLEKANDALEGSIGLPAIQKQLTQYQEEKAAETTVPRLTDA